LLLPTLLQTPLTLAEAEELRLHVRVLHLLLQGKEGLGQTVIKLASTEGGPGHNHLTLQARDTGLGHTDLLYSM
jgi:hypothetical protein